MGLDITAFEKVDLLLPLAEGWSEELQDREDVYVLYTPEGVEDRSDGLPRGYYFASGEQEHLGFSYSGYNTWRKWLSLTFIGVPPERIWENPAVYKDSPFVELVDYSDNEGFFGPKTCLKLAADFAGQVPRNNPYHEASYEKFRRAFSLAAGGGVVRFH